MRRPLGSVLLLLVVGLAGIGPARADSANNIFRLGAGWLDPDGKVSTSGNNIDVDSTTSYFVSYERRLIPWLGLDFQVAYSNPDVTSTPTGGGPTTAQSESNYTGTAGVNFHFFARSRFDLYLGAFYSYTDFDKAFDNASGYGAVLGFDIGITKSGLAITTAVRYTQMEVDLKGTTGATADYNPLMYQLGLGWRF